MAARTIIETKPGYFKDPATNKRTKKEDGDKVVSAAEWEKANPASKAKAAKPAAKPTTLTTGKVTTSPTVEITCAEKGCKEKRVIKKQDAFQVKYCIPHQKENRNKLRRDRRAAKAKAKK